MSVACLGVKAVGPALYSFYTEIFAQARIVDLYSLGFCGSVAHVQNSRELASHRKRERERGIAGSHARGAAEADLVRCGKNNRFELEGGEFYIMAVDRG